VEYNINSLIALLKRFCSYCRYLPELDLKAIVGPIVRLCGPILAHDSRPDGKFYPINKNSPLNWAILYASQSIRKDPANI